MKTTMPTSTRLPALPVLLRALLALLALAGAPGMAAAQSCLSIRPGDPVQYRVVGGAGVQSGELVELGRDDLAVRTDAGVRRYPADRLRDVRVHCTMRIPDRRRSALVGGALGAVLGLVAALVVENNTRDDGQVAGTSNQPWEGPGPWIGVGVGGGIGAALGGALAGDGRGWQRVTFRNGPGFAPVPLPGGRGVAPLVRPGPDGAVSLGLRIPLPGRR